MKQDQIIPAKMTSKNQITIPKLIREVLSIHDKDTILFKIKPDGEVQIKPKREKNLWDIVREQEEIYGTIRTEEIEWGDDVEAEDFD